MNPIVPFVILFTLLLTHVTIKPSENLNIKGISVSATPSQTQAATTAPKPKSMETSVGATDNSIAESESSAIYPNSYAIERNTYESVDNPSKITDWYKNFIIAHNMNATSFVTTNTNNNIKNVLAASNGSQKFYIEITKSADSLYTTIKFK